PTRQRDRAPSPPPTSGAWSRSTTRPGRRPAAPRPRRSLICPPPRRLAPARRATPSSGGNDGHEAARASSPPRALRVRRYRPVEPHHREDLDARSGQPRPCHDSEPRVPRVQPFRGERRGGDRRVAPRHPHLARVPLRRGRRVLVRRGAAASARGRVSRRALHGGTHLRGRAPPRPPRPPGRGGIAAPPPPGPAAGRQPAGLPLPAVPA